MASSSSSAAKNKSLLFRYYYVGIISTLFVFIGIISRVYNSMNNLRLLQNSITDNNVPFILVHNITTDHHNNVSLSSSFTTKLSSFHNNNQLSPPLVSTSPQDTIITKPMTTTEIITTDGHAIDYDHFQCPDLILSSSMTNITRNTTTTMTTYKHNNKIKKKRYITMVVELVGQVGNYLGYFARAYAIKRSMEKLYLRDNQLHDNDDNEELIIQFIGQHQRHEQADRVYNEAKICFPNMFQQLYQNGGRWDKSNTFSQYHNQQNKWINEILRQYQLYIKQNQQQNQQQSAIMNNDNNTRSLQQQTNDNNNITNNKRRRKIEYHAQSLILDSNMNPCRENLTTGMYCYQETYCLLRAMIHQQRNEPYNIDIQQQQQSNNNNDNSNDDDNNNTQEYQINNNIMTNSLSLPYLTSKSLRYIFAIDEYYEDLRQLYRFNEKECCGDNSLDTGTMILNDINTLMSVQSSLLINETNHDQTRQRQQQEHVVTEQQHHHYRHPPYDDEIVFHIRHFGIEFRVVGFHEMEPKQVANELFQPYINNLSIPIALVSKNVTLSMEYENQLRYIGFNNIRQISGNNGMEDFCFLIRTKYHLIGMKMSTFVSWAGILSNATKVRLYAMDSRYTRRNKDLVQFLLNHYEFHNKQLYKQIQYETYKYKKS